MTRITLSGNPKKVNGEMVWNYSKDSRILTEIRERDLMYLMDNKQIKNLRNGVKVFYIEDK